MPKMWSTNDKTINKFYLQQKRWKIMTAQIKNQDPELNSIKTYIESKGFVNISTDDSENQIYKKEGSRIVIREK